MIKGGITYIMKHTFAWIVVLVLLLGVALSVAAQQPGRMHGEGMMGGKGMMGGRSSSFKPTEGAASNYRQLCANCHGVTGKADGPVAKTLKPRPKDFTDAKVMAHSSNETLFKIIKGGGQSTGHSPMMPAWAGILTDQQISELVGYIRSFSKK